MTRAGGNRSGHLMIVLSTARIDDKTEDKETIGSPDGFGPTLAARVTVYI